VLPHGEDDGGLRVFDDGGHEGRRVGELQGQKSAPGLHRRQARDNVLDAAPHVDAHNGILAHARSPKVGREALRAAVELLVGEGALLVGDGDIFGGPARLRFDQLVQAKVFRVHVFSILLAQSLRVGRPAGFAKPTIPFSSHPSNTYVKARHPRKTTHRARVKP